MPVGIIRINMTHIPNHMTIIFKIISTLHRVNGVHFPRVKFLTALSTNFTKFIPRFWFIYSFSCSTNRRNIWFGKEYRRVPTTNSKFTQFTILPTSNSPYSFSRASNWRRIWARKAFGSLLWKNAKHVGLIISNFQESYSSFPVSPIQNEQPSILDLSMEALRESEQ